MRFRVFRVDWDTLIFFENFRELRAMREVRNGSKRVKKNFFFFCIFTRFRAFWVDWDTLFFFVNFREREARNERDASAKPEGAKRPSSPAGLAGRSAERACKLVDYYICNTFSNFAQRLWKSPGNCDRNWEQIKFTGGLRETRQSHSSWLSQDLFDWRIRYRQEGGWKIHCITSFVRHIWD